MMQLWYYANQQKKLSFAMIMTHVDNRLLAKKNHPCTYALSVFCWGGTPWTTHGSAIFHNFCYRGKTWGKSTIFHPLRIHIFNMHLHLAYKWAINVSKYTSPKDPMGPYWCMKTSQNWWFICHLVTATDDRIEGNDTWWSNCAKQCNGLFCKW